MNARIASPYNDRIFPVTRHSALEALRNGDEPQRRRALETLAAAYWRPVFAYVRARWRKEPDEAAELTQDFFAQLVEKDLLAKFDPSRARLRTFLRMQIDGVVSNARRAAGRQKRQPVELELDPAKSPEALFEEQWARGVFALGLERLRARKPAYVQLFEEYESQRTTYAELAAKHGLAVTDVTNHLAWVRRELRAAVLDVLRESTATDAEFRDEARALLGLAP